MYKNKPKRKISRELFYYRHPELLLGYNIIQYYVLCMHAKHFNFYVYNHKSFLINRIEHNYLQNVYNMICYRYKSRHWEV